MGEGFPLWSMASMMAKGREPHRDWISLSVFPSVSVLSDSALSPFLKFPEIRNSDWIETMNMIFLDISFLAAKEGQQPPYGVSTRVGAPPPPWGTPPASWAPRASSRVDSTSQNSHIFQKISVSFYPIWTPFDMDFLRNKKAWNKQELTLGTGSIC